MNDYNQSGSISGGRVRVVRVHPAAQEAAARRVWAWRATAAWSTGPTGRSWRDLATARPAPPVWIVAELPLMTTIYVTDPRRLPPLLRPTDSRVTIFVGISRLFQDSWWILGTLWWTHDDCLFMKRIGNDCGRIGSGAAAPVFGPFLRELLAQQLPQFVVEFGIGRQIGRHPPSQRQRNALSRSSRKILQWLIDEFQLD